MSDVVELDPAGATDVARRLRSVRSTLGACPAVPPAGGLPAAVAGTIEAIVADQQTAAASLLETAERLADTVDDVATRTRSADQQEVR
jgi:hypothetical protein